MATFPVSGLLAEFEVLSFEAFTFSAEVSDFRAQSRQRGNQRQGGVVGAPELDQLAIHDQPGLPKRDKRGRGESPQFESKRTGKHSFGGALPSISRKSFADKHLHQ